MKRSLAVAAACALALAGCGHHAPNHPAPVVAAPCPANQSYLGCAQPAQGLTITPKLAPPAGALFPDVSVWQGAVNWPAIAAWQHRNHWKAAAIFKVGEYTLDPQAIRNASETARLGFWRAGYWFVRNTGCQHEAALMVWAARRLGLKALIMDSEVLEARGYVACLTPQLKAAGLIPEEYTSPGTNPDSSAHPAGLGTWGAAFGPSRPCFPWGCGLLAWQYTDGRWGAVTPIPGLGSGDVSVDYGITKLGVPKPKPLPVCFTHRMPASQCAIRKVQIASLNGASTASWRAWHRARCVGLLHRRGYVPGCSALDQRAHYFTSRALAVQAQS